MLVIHLKIIIVTIILFMVIIIMVNLNQGDMLVYKGNILEHWREPFLGLNHAQVFLHYNENNEENIKNYLDGRPMFGIPKLT